MAEEELSVEVRYIDCVHVDDINILHSGQREILQDLTAQPTSADDKDPSILQRIDGSSECLRIRVSARSRENRVKISPLSSTAVFMPVDA